MVPMKAYLLPEDPNPANLRCVRMYLPDDPGFFAAFWGSMDYLATWLAWERDTQQTGKIAADRMKYAVEISRTAWLTGVCCTPPPIIYPDPPGDGRDEPTATIDDWLWYWRDVVNDIDDRLDDSQDLDDIKTAIGERLSVELGDTYQPIADTLVDNIGSLTSQERDDLQDPDKWEQLRDKIQCDPDAAEPDYATSFYDWLNWAADEIFGWLDNAASDLFDAFNGVFDSLTGGSPAAIVAASASAAAGGGAGFGWGVQDCGWTHTFDFTTGEHSFYAASKGGINAGVWDSGVGWKTTFGPYSDGTKYAAVPWLDFPDDLYITYIEVHYYRTGSGGSAKYAMLRLDGAQASFSGVTSAPVGASQISWSPNTIGDAMFAAIDLANPEAWITQIVISGQGGTDPFAGY